jgi:hypothetical protein
METSEWKNPDRIFSRSVIPDGAGIRRQKPDGTNQYLLIADFGDAINTLEP